MKDQATVAEDTSLKDRGLLAISKCPLYLLICSTNRVCMSIKLKSLEREVGTLNTQSFVYVNFSLPEINFILQVALLMVWVK